MVGQAEIGGEVTSKLVARVANELRSIVQESGWTRTLAIGELVLCSFFKGDVHAWRDRHRNKDTSIRRLAERPECPLAKTALTEAVGVYVVCRELIWVRQFDQITPSHVAAVIGLDEPDQIRLLRSVIEEGAGVRSLKRRALEIRRRGGERRGRPASPRARKNLTHLQGIIRGLREINAELRALAEFDDLTRTGLRVATRELCDAAVDLSELLETGSMVGLLPPQPKPLSTIAPRLETDAKQRAG